MAHTLIGFAHSSNETNTKYIADQLDQLRSEISGLQTDTGDETDARLLKFVTNHDRLPCLLLLKNDTYKSHINAKLSQEKALGWVIEKIG